MAYAILVAHTQNYENYAFDDNDEINTEAPYWKAKSGDEFIIAELSELDVDCLGEVDYQRMCEDSAVIPESDGYYRWDLIGHDVIILTAQKVARVKAIIDSNPVDLGFARYEFGSTVVWDWAVTQLPKQYQELKY